jgi:hypothetical protein
MPGLVPGIHVFLQQSKTWMAGTSPAMTRSGCIRYAASGTNWTRSRRASFGSAWPSTSVLKCSVC